MDRAIKIRVWDKANCVMTSDPFAWFDIRDSILDYAEGQFVRNDPDNRYEVMQYTGLKDKKNNLIFEGDIVRILYTDWCSQSQEKNGRYSMSLEDYKDSISNIGKIVFLDCKFCIQFNDDGYTGSIHCGTHGQIKVIGNIWENPGLIGL